jgi:hypothetical protein
MSNLFLKKNTFVGNPAIKSLLSTPPESPLAIPISKFLSQISAPLGRLSDLGGEAIDECFIDSKANVINYSKDVVLFSRDISAVKPASLEISGGDLDEIYIVYTNNIPVGFTLNENKAKEYISKFAESLMSPKYTMSKINYYLIEIRFPGYLLDEIVYTIKYEKIPRLI